VWTPDLFPRCASDVKSDLKLVDMVHVHKRLMLIILAREVTWHLNGKTCLVEVVAGAAVESIAEAVGATTNYSGAVSSSYLAVNVCAMADGV